MIHAITHAAHRLDQWLQHRLGRPYNLLLGVGLTIEIVRRLIEIPDHLAHMHRLVGTVLVVLLEAALLVHQVGALSHHIRPRKSAPPSGDSAGTEAAAETR